MNNFSRLLVQTKINIVIWTVALTTTMNSFFYPSPSALTHFYCDENFKLFATEIFSLLHNLLTTKIDFNYM